MLFLVSLTIFVSSGTNRVHVIVYVPIINLSCEPFYHFSLNRGSLMSVHIPV